MKLFPHILLRLGAGSFDKLLPLASPALVLRAEEYARAQAALAKDKEQLCAHLLEIIREHEAPREQNLLQNLRRDIFNERNVKPQILETVTGVLPPATRQLVRNHLSARTEFSQQRIDFQTDYTATLTDTRRYLQQLATNDNLRKGLIVSSQALLNTLDSFTQRASDSFRKREHQTELSVLKYLTRIHTKTSPFSTFNNLALARPMSMSATPFLRYRVLRRAQNIASHVRINSLLFRYLKSIIARFRPLARLLTIRLNPTVELRGHNYAYLTNHDNIEAFQELAVSPLLVFVVETVGEAADNLSNQQLIGLLVEATDATNQEIENYIGQLVDYGFLAFDFGASGTDPDWDQVLVRQLLRWQHVAHVPSLVQMLQQLRAAAQAYEQETVETRQGILATTYQQVRAVCWALHEAAGLPAAERMALPPDPAIAALPTAAPPPEAAPAPKPSEFDESPVFRHISATRFSFLPEQLFYEDTTRAVEASISQEHLTALVQKIDGLFGQLQELSIGSTEREQMQHFFRAKYGADARPSLLDFYECYYREVKKPAAEASRAAADASSEGDKMAVVAVPNGNATSKMYRWQQAYANLIGPGIGGGEEVHLTHAAVVAATRQLGLAKSAAGKRGPQSSGVFIQLFEDTDKYGATTMKAKLNGSFTGFGKMISRFLHILDPAVTQEVRDCNAAACPDDCLLLENTDGSYFNANLHPSLLPYEICVPGGHNNVPVANQLPITDFVVEFDATSAELILCHQPSGKRAYVFNLGFQAAAGRSQLFNLLENFAPAEAYPLHLLTNAVQQAQQQQNPALVDTARIRLQPRIIYEQQLVLQRRRWVVPVELLPVREQGQTDADYFLALQQWRTQAGIDEQVFAISSSRGNTGRGGKRAAGAPAAGRDDYKPQYIDFASPLLVRVFEKMLTKVSVQLQLEEMLPAPGHLYQTGQDMLVSELVVQWYK
jgi:hypothetical protein